MKIIDYNGTPLHLVPHEPDNGYRFYMSRDGTIGLRIAPNGTESLQKAIPTTRENNSNKTNANRKQRYWQFRHPWNSDEHILVSHAVYLAWSGKPIPPDHQIHHLNGITTDNRLDNLVCVSKPEHRLYDIVQRELRASGRLATMTTAEILVETRSKILTDPLALAARDIDKYR